MLMASRRLGFKMPEQSSHYDRFMAKKIARIEARKAALNQQQSSGGALTDIKTTEE